MLYDYECGDCGFEHYDVKQAMEDKPLRRCPSCKKLKLTRVINQVNFMIYDEPSTIGHQAERNVSRMGPLEYASKLEQAKLDKQKLQQVKQEELQKKMPNATVVDRTVKIKESPYGTLPDKQKKNLKDNDMKAVEKYIRDGE